MRDHEQQQDDRDNEEADGSSSCCGRELRDRAASSTAAASAGRLHGERGRRCHSSAEVRRSDVSALSVEIAVATVQNNQRQQREQREQHNAAQDEHHVPAGLTGAGTAAASAGEGRRKAPHRRGASLVSRVFGGSAGSSAARDNRTASLEERHGRGSHSTDRASSADPRHEGDEEKQAENQQRKDEAQEEEEEEEEDSEHQHVVRRHEPQRSVPSVVDLFRLQPSSFTQPTTPSAALPSPSVAGHAPPAVAASLSAEDLAASLQVFSAGQHQHQHQASPAARYAPSTPPPSVYRDESAATAAPSPTPPDGSNHHATASRRGRSGSHDARSSASPRGRIGDGRHQPRHHQDGDQQQQGVLTRPPQEVCTAVPPGVAARDKEQQQQQVLYGGGVTYPLYTGGDNDDDDAEGEEDDDALGALQQQQEELSLARHLREASTNTVDAGREGRMAYDGGATADWDAGRSDGYHLRQREVRKATYYGSGAPDISCAHVHTSSSSSNSNSNREPVFVSPAC